MRTPKLRSLIPFLFLFLFGSLFCAHPLCVPALAGDEPFVYPSNGGFTGIMEIPTARVMKENSYRIGASQIDPYRYYYMTFSPLRGIEINGKVTEILGVKASSSDPKLERLWQLQRTNPLMSNSSL